MTKAIKVDRGLEVHKTGMAYRLDGGLGDRARIGLIVLATDQSIEHEFRCLLNLPGVAVYHSRIENSPNITPETLAEMADGITDATRVIMPGLPMDVIAYACTSGAMVIGAEAVAEKIHAARPGVACTTPMAATVAALQALGARRVCFIAPYIEEINRAMRAYLVEAGFEVPVMGSWNEADDTKVARISPASIREAALALGGDERTDAVFLACTSLRLAEQVEALEAELGKPVTSSDHAIAWHCLRLAGCDETVPGAGALFKRRLA